MQKRRVLGESWGLMVMQTRVRVCKMGFTGGIGNGTCHCTVIREIRAGFAEIAGP